MLRKRVHVRTIGCVVLGMCLSAPAFAQTEAPLNWVDDPGAPGLCGGYYLEALDQDVYQAPVAFNLAETQVSADIFQVKNTGVSELSGHVVVTQPGRQLTADNALLTRNDAGEFTHITLLGRVTLREAGRLIQGNRAEVDLVANEAWVNDIEYRLFSVDETAQLIALSKTQNTAPVTGLTLRGRAEKLWRDDTGMLHLSRGTLTSCPPSALPAWQLHASRMNFNLDSGWGNAKNVRLKFKNLPLLYIPYLNFPLDNRRKSGLLYPQISYSSSSGMEVAQPIYWNMAPNFDGLFIPNYLADRGMLWRGQVRYLTPNSEGRMRGFVIWDDREFARLKKNAPADFGVIPAPPELKRLTSASDTRGMISWQHQAVLAPTWRSDIDFNWVSDDYIPQDFHALSLETTQDQLTQKAGLHFSSAHWDILGEVLYYDTLHPLNRAFVAEQYGRLPGVSAQGIFPGIAGPFDADLLLEGVHFWRDQNPGETTRPVAGDRFHIAPGVSVPLISERGAYLIPSARFDFTAYELNHNAPNDNHITRSLPILSVDAGLKFLRPIQLGQTQWLQTLEPRLFYLYIPEVGQSEIPLFDTDVNLFTYPQLFRTNRFNGIDRINDANQLSIALSSRLLNRTNGFQVAQWSIGQLVYFKDRAVQLCVKTPGACVDARTDITRSSLSNTATLSPLVSELTVFMTPIFQLHADAAYRTDKQRLNNATLYAHLQPNTSTFFHVGYAFLRDGDNLTSVSSPTVDDDNLSQIDVAAALPLGRQWKVLGRWHYNLSHDHPQTYLYGLEYESCCVAFRIVGGRTYKGVDEQNQMKYNRAFYIQLQFKGLGHVGSDPSRALRQQMVGYQDRFAQNTPMAFFKG